MGFLLSLLFKLPVLADKLLGYLQKKADVNLETYKTGVQADTAVNVELIRARIEEQKIIAATRAADRGSLWTAWMAPAAFLPCVVHFGAVMFDSVPLFGHEVGSWRVPALPAPYDAMEQSIILAVIGLNGGKAIVRQIFTR